MHKCVCSYFMILAQLRLDGSLHVLKHGLTHDSYRHWHRGPIGYCGMAPVVKIMIWKKQVVISLWSYARLCTYVATCWPVSLKSVARRYRSKWLYFMSWSLDSMKCRKNLGFARDSSESKPEIQVSLWRTNVAASQNASLSSHFCSLSWPLCSAFKK